MSWLARLKKTECVPELDTTETTKRVSVVSVGAIPEPFQKSGGDPGAANDPAPDPDRWAWPHSTAMNTAEIDTFTARLARFTDRGLILADAEALADKLVNRDREGDDRRLCLECASLHRGGRCGNWQAAGVAIRARDAQLPGDFTTMLQRCGGFGAQLESIQQTHTHDHHQTHLRHLRGIQPKGKGQ